MRTAETPARGAAPEGQRSGFEKQRSLVTGIALVRTILGTGALVMPSAARVWVGDLASRPPARVLSRSLGGRDIALGVGTMIAARRDRLGALGLWSAMSALADATDAIGTMAGGKALPSKRRALVGAFSASVALAGGLCAFTLGKSGGPARWSGRPPVIAAIPA